MKKENVVWITGASSGIGKAMAFEWARLGYKVALSSRRKELLDNVAKKISDSGGEALVIPCDIMEETDIENAVREIITSWGRLDVVVANAGFGVFGSWIFCEWLQPSRQHRDRCRLTMLFCCLQQGTCCRLHCHQSPRFWA